MLHAALLLDDVLEQEVARVGVRAARVDGRAPLRELRRRTGSAGTPTAPSCVRVSPPLTHCSVNGFMRLWRALTACSSSARNGVALMDGPPGRDDTAYHLAHDKRGILELARSPVARRRRQGPCRTFLEAGAVEGRRARVRRTVVRSGSRDRRPARGLDLRRPALAGPVRLAGRHPENPRPPAPPRPQGVVLRARRGRQALPRRADAHRRRGSRDRHARVDPRAHEPAARGRGAGPHGARLRHAVEGDGTAAGRRARAVVGLQPEHAQAHPRDGPALRLVADGGRRAVRAAWRTACPRASSSCRWSGSRTTPPTST